jgi:SNW domain-containing protein 1
MKKREFKNELVLKKPTNNSTSDKNAPSYVKYTPMNPSASTRIIRIAEVQVDPLEPPKFKHKKVPLPPSSPPAPVLHSPPRKTTREEQLEWAIPPCISNWKNAKGFTIPLDKRLASDGRGLQEATINDRFATFAEALYIADHHAREEVEKRAQLQKKLAEKEREKKEQRLQELAEEVAKDKTEIIERTQSNRREFSRKHEERDINEKIALGQKLPASGKEFLYDQRLFNQSSGLSSGFKDDDLYDLYDKPLFKGSSMHSIYRPKVSNDNYLGADDTENQDSGKRFVPAKSFKGADIHIAERDGPVEFEKESSDLFGLEKFLNQAKKGKRSEDLLGEKEEGNNDKRQRY